MAKIDKQQQRAMHLLQFIAEAVKSTVLPQTAPPDGISLPLKSLRHLKACERILESNDKVMQLVRFGSHFSCVYLHVYFGKV